MPEILTYSWKMENRWDHIDRRTPNTLQGNNLKEMNWSRETQDSEWKYSGRREPHPQSQEPNATL